MADAHTRSADTGAQKALREPVIIYHPVRFRSLLVDTCVVCFHSHAEALKGRVATNAVIATHGVKLYAA